MNDNQKFCLGVQKLMSEHAIPHAEPNGVWDTHWQQAWSVFFSKHAINPSIQSMQPTTLQHIPPQLMGKFQQIMKGIHSGEEVVADDASKVAAKVEEEIKPSETPLSPEDKVEYEAAAPVVSAESDPVVAEEEPETPDEEPVESDKADE